MNHEISLPSPNSQILVLQTLTNIGHYLYITGKVEEQEMMRKFGQA